MCASSVELVAIISSVNRGLLLLGKFVFSYSIFIQVNWNFEKLLIFKSLHHAEFRKFYSNQLDL